MIELLLTGASLEQLDIKVPEADGGASSHHSRAPHSLFCRLSEKILSLQRGLSVDLEDLIAEETVVDDEAAWRSEHDNPTYNW